jgi:hypothetical protein
MDGLSHDPEVPNNELSCPRRGALPSRADSFRSAYIDLFIPTFTRFSTSHHHQHYNHHHFPLHHYNMVSFFSTLTIAAVAFVGAAHGLTEGEYYRPTGAEVSSQVGATTAYVRSPCPALNTLANHGYLPRDGKDITRAQYTEALAKGFNIGGDVAALLVNNIPAVISLSGLSEHNLIEHDASLAHADSYYKKEPSALDATLWADLLSRAKDGKFGVSQLASARKNRMELCKSKPTGCDFGAKQRFLAFGESALLLRGLGGNNDESCSVAFAKSFFEDERFPADFVKPKSQVNLPELLATVAKIQALAPFQ